MTPADDFITRSECDRSHEALARENDRSNQTVTASVNALTNQVNKVWDAIETLRNNYRNHVPPWATALITVLSILVGIFGGAALR